MKLAVPTAALLALLAAAPAFAVTTIDFEGPTSYASIGAYYNGGADSAGKAGPSLGVSFGGDALALANDAFGPYFTNAPSPAGVMTPVGADSTMNLPAGFGGAFGFHYSSSAAVAGGVQVWSGTDAGGTLLASFDLAANAQAGGCSSSPYCHFDLVTTTLANTARSVSFGNAANSAVFDDVSVTAVPEPASALLMALGLAGVLAVRRRG